MSQNPFAASLFYHPTIVIIILSFLVSAKAAKHNAEIDAKDEKSMKNQWHETSKWLKKLNKNKIEFVIIDKNWYNLLY